MATLDDLEAQVQETETVESAAVAFIGNVPPPLDEARLGELVARLDASEKSLANALGMSADARTKTAIAKLAPGDFLHAISVGIEVLSGIALLISGQSASFRFSYKGRKFTLTSDPVE